MKFRLFVLFAILTKISFQARELTGFYNTNIVQARPQLRLNTDLRAKTYAKESYHSAQWANNFRDYYGDQFDRTDDYGSAFEGRSNYFYRDYADGNAPNLQQYYSLPYYGYGYYGDDSRFQQYN